MKLSKWLIHVTAENVDRVAKELQTDMKSIVNVQTGALRDSITIEKHGKTRTSVGVDPAKLKRDPRNPDGRDYSLDYFHGNKGGKVLTPTRRQFMRFIGTRDGKVVYARRAVMRKRDGHDFISETLLRRRR